MDTVNKYIAGFFAVAALVVIFRDRGAAAANVIQALGQANASTFRALGA